VAAIRKSRAEIEALMKDYESAAPLQEAGGRAVERLSAREKEVYQVDYETVEDGDNLPGKLISQVRHRSSALPTSRPNGTRCVRNSMPSRPPISPPSTGGRAITPCDFRVADMFGSFP
jgi:hypothetical protein